MDINTISKNDLKFQQGSNILVSGCTMSGKTQWCTKLLANADKMFTVPPEICMFSYSHWQPAYDELQRIWGSNILFMQDLQTEDFLAQMMQGRKHGLFVIDDKASEIPDSAYFMNLLTRFGHHYRLSNVVLVQDPSLGGRMKSVLAKNFHVNILMRSPRDRQYIRSLGVMLNDYKCLIESYDEATKEAFSYICVDLHPSANPLVKYRAKIFPDDDHVVVYRRPTTSQ